MPCRSIPVMSCVVLTYVIRCLPSPGTHSQIRQKPCPSCIYIQYQSQGALAFAAGEHAREYAPLYDTVHPYQRREAPTLESKMHVDSMRCDTIEHHPRGTGKGVSHPPTSTMQLVSSKRTNLCQSTSQSTCTTKSIVSTPPSRLQEAAKR